jgi:hypothetical protein
MTVRLIAKNATQQLHAQLVLTITTSLLHPNVCHAAQTASLAQTQLDLVPNAIPETTYLEVYVLTLVLKRTDTTRRQVSFFSKIFDLRLNWAFSMEI